MLCRVANLCEKEVICIKDGTKIGNVCDVELDIEKGQILTLVVYGRPRCFGILGREEDFIINWCEIKIIGEDTILVGCAPPRDRCRRKGFLSTLLGKR
ncbi:MAG TPA: YlmC/YmxH family sporulation protein [Ruminococcaceae bacterium]|nr:YlmC/YmxH family sporulation protein [Oscillospiraceae bacterium]